MDLIENAGKQMSYHMDEILKLFNYDGKITVLVRNPNEPDGSQDMMLSNDDTESAVAALRLIEQNGTVR